MDPSKAKVIMKLLSSKHLQVKGLRELKKRLLDFANIAVFRKLKLVPILLKIIEAHGSICAQKTSGDACSNEDPSQSTLEDKDKLIVESMDVQELEFEDLQRLKDLSYSEAQQAETSFVPLVNIDQVDTNSEQVVLYTLSLLCTMLQDHGAKHQCEGLEGVRIVMPFITCKSQLIADRAVRATARMVELPGNNRDMFIRFKGPKLLLDQLLKPNFEDVSFQKTLLIAIRIVSCCGSCCEAVLRHKGLETVCVVGLPSVSLQQPAVAIIATYSSLQQQEALIQLLDGTKELSLLLRTWQDNRDCASIHASTLRVMVNLVQLASRATEQLHSNVRQNWVAGGGRREEGGGLGKDGYQRGNANLTALRLRLLKAFFAIKTATPLVTEIASYEGAAGEKIVSTLCTLCDGSLELQNSPSGRSNLALVWLQVVEAGGIKPFVRLLLKGDSDVDSPDGDEDASNLARLQKKILRAMLALENNHGIQEIVFKHCLASGILPALTRHFDAAFTRYQNCRGPYIEGSLCTHQQATLNITGKSKDTCQDSASANTLNRRHSSSELRRSLSACNVPGRWKNMSDNRSLSPPLIHPLAPLSPPSSPQEAPKFVYTPYSPPQKKYAHVRSACTSPNPPAQFYTSRSPSASPPHFPSYSPIKPGCASPSSVGGWSSLSCSPSYSPSHSPSYTPPSQSSSYSPSHSPSYSFQSSYSPSRSPTRSPTFLSSPALPSKQARDLPESSNCSSVVTREDRACIKYKSDRETDDTYSRMKRNRRSSEDITNDDSKKFKVIRIVSPDSALINDLPDERSNPHESVSNSNNMDGRCLAEMVTEKLLQSHVKRSFSETETCSEGTWKNERETLPTLQVHENDSLNGGTNYDDSLPPKMVKIDQTSTQCTLNSSKTATSSLPATQKVVHVRNMNHIKFRVGKSIRERRSSESYLKTTSVDKIVAETESNSKEDKCVLDDTIRNSGYQISSSPETPEVINGFTIGHENTGCVSGRIESIFDDDELSVGHTGGNSDSKECAVTDPAVYDRKENVASLEDNLKSMDVDDNCDKNVASLNGTKLSQNVGTTVSAASEQRGNSVPVREFNHIKFRVGKRTKDKRPDAGQPSTGPGHPVPKPSHRQDELQRYCLNDAQPKVFPVTNSSLPTSSALTSTRSSVGTRKPTSLQCSTNGNKSSNADLVRACETKLSSCKLDKNDGPSAATRADIHKQDGLEESLRHLELVVRIITQVCQIREALSGVCREFLPRVMLYLRHSHRLHPAASRFLSTISQTPCSIQGLLDTFFPAYVAVQLCESLVNSKKKRNSCNCGFCCNGKVTCNLEKSCSSPESGTFTSCAKSEAKLSSSSSSLDNYNRSLDASGASCSALKTKQPEGHNACMARSSNTTIDLHKEDSEHSKGSRENGRCSLQSTNVCNECTMLVTGGQSFLLNMSKFFGHVHRYGSQEAGNRLKPNAPACVRETCSLNIPHIARCPSQLQQLMLNGGCLQDIFSVLREDEPPSAVRYIYAAAALHALANAVDICGQTPLGKGCALCLVSAAAEDEADEINDFTGTLQPPHVKATEKIHKDSSSGKKKEASENSSALHGKCFWSEQVGHDVILMCSAGDEDELMENQETWREDEDEYSEEELTDAEGFLDDEDSKTSDIPTNRKTLNSKSGDELSSLKMNVCDDDTSHGDRVNASGKNYFPEQKSDAGIQAHRSILCGASEVWAVMLGEQGWREATDGVIRVGGLGQHALTAIVHHLYGCTCAALSSLTLHEYVELLHACHMYGLKQLQNYAAHRIVQTCSTAMDVLTVYHASVGLVDKDVITGVLVRMIACKDVRSWRRAQWLHTLAHAPPGEQLLNNIHSLLFHALEANKNTCTCDTSQGLYMTSNSVYSKLI